MNLLFAYDIFGKTALLVAISSTFNFALSLANADDQYSAFAKVKMAEQAVDLHKAYRKLLDPCSHEQLELLKLNTNHGIAIQSAWESAKNSVIEAEQKRTVDSKVIYGRFIGFVEGRIGARIPDWWSSDLSNMTMREGKLHIAEKDYGHFFGGDKDYEYAYPKAWTLRKQPNSHTIISQGNNRITFDDRILDEGAMTTITGAWSTKYFAIASFCHTGGTYPVYLIDRISTKAEWKATVWVGHDASIAGTGIEAEASNVELSFSDKALWVFGRRLQSLYIEGFALDDGHCIGRFSTTY